jgi:hypothetical protein
MLLGRHRCLRNGRPAWCSAMAGGGAETAVAATLNTAAIG